MTVPAGWHNPITAAPGSLQRNVLAADLLPARRHLVQSRLDAQRALLAAGQTRHTPIEVTVDGVIWDGHHGARAAAELGQTVEVKVIGGSAKPVGVLLLDLPVR